MEQKKTVLIVEDEKNIVDIIRFNLQRTGYNTLEAYDGESGLAMAREKKPDLILLDVMMPKMMGFDVCRALRAEGDNVPVIILTAREEEEDKILGLEIGADDYITKPFSMRELMARVKANIRRRDLDYGVRPKGELLQEPQCFPSYCKKLPLSGELPSKARLRGFTTQRRISNYENAFQTLCPRRADGRGLPRP